ncbi:MAG: trigger factor [Eubacteriales bacterium]|nr:trigger factor [Eubacteriales bacterium]
MKKSRIALIVAVCVCISMAMSGCGRPYSGYTLSDYVKVGKYKGLEVKKYTVHVTSSQVSKEIKSRLKKAAKTEDVTTGTVKKGDTVTISYNGKINGKSFSGGSSDNASVTIGSKQFIDGFESGLIGLSPGDSKTLHLTFPKDYNDSDVAGKDVTFKVKVKSIQKQVTPSLDEEFVKENSKYKTVAAYKAYIKKYLEKKEKKEGETDQKTYLWDKVLSSSKVKTDKNGKEKYPQDEIDRVVKDTRSMYTRYAKSYNMKLKDFVKNQMGMTTTQFNKQLKSYAKDIVKEEEVIYYIADKEDIKVSKKEYKAYIKKTLKQYGYTEKSFKDANGESYEDSQGKENIWKACYLEKVENFILSKAKVVDKVSD